MLTAAFGNRDVAQAVRRPSTLFLLTAIAACYAETLMALLGQWYSNQAYSYAFAVPIISLFVVNTQLRRGPVVVVVPDYLGGSLVLIASTVMFVLGRLASILAVQEIALAISIVGLVLLFAGRAVVRRLWFPLAYLFLMIPIWDRPIDILHTSGQQLSARLATSMLHYFDIPALRTDTLIILPNVTLEVARECSGINQLIAVFAIALPAAYLMIRGNLRRVCIVAFALIVALISNGLRIAAIGAWSYHGWIGGDVHGPYHVLQGLAVSCVGFAVIGLSLVFFSNNTIETDRSSVIRRSPIMVRRPAVDIALGLMLLAAASPRMWLTGDPVPLTTTFDQFPRQVGEWTETWTDPVRSSQVKVAGVDDELVRTFRNDEGRRIRLYVGYFREQEQQREIVGASTQELVEEASRKIVTIGPEARPIELSAAARPVGSKTIFWFDVNGRLIADAYQAKFFSLVDALTRRRTNGAVVIVSWDDVDDTAPNAEPQRLAFLRDVIPLLRNYIPS